MKTECYRREACRLCNSDDLEVALQLAPTPLADSYVSANHLDKVQEEYPLDLYLCYKCGFTQLLDIVQPEVIYIDYIYKTASSLGLYEHFERYADKVVNIIGPEKGSLVIDIGSNDGMLLRFFENHGMRVLGIDPAKDIANAATESGIETLPAFFDGRLGRQIKNDRGAASVVTVNNLFANIDDLADFTEGIRGLLAPDGVFVFESFYLSDLIQNMVFDFTYHEHLSYFSVKPLKFFFRRHNMELIDVERIATKGGSLRCMVQKADGPRKVSPSVDRLISDEENRGIQRVETFKIFADKIDGVKNQLETLLGDLKKKGKAIIGYGASPTTTTLIYHFDIADILSFLVDDNPLRQNLYSPGYHIPVLSPELIYKEMPDYVLVMAWRYAEPIISKHKGYIDQGGHFIKPLPEVVVI